MRIAIPLDGDLLAVHFGHCARFALVDVDPLEKRILKRENVAAPPHQPGLFPGWLAKRGAQVVFAGSMGRRAQGLLAERGISVMLGVPADTPESLIAEYLDGTLETGENTCDH